MVEQNHVLTVNTNGLHVDIDGLPVRLVTVSDGLELRSSSEIGFLSRSWLDEVGKRLMVL